MLTRDQLQRIAQRERIGLQAQERDYVQVLFLANLYANSQALIFKGGTALRIVHRGGRYSEDLDFTATTAQSEVISLLDQVLYELTFYGLVGEWRDAWQGPHGYSVDLSYRGPLYDGRDRTKGKIRLDISLRSEVIDSERRLISSDYDDIRPFIISVLTPTDLLAEKIRAFLVRAKPRDVYDLWLLNSKGWVIDRERVGHKLALYQLDLTPSLVDQALDQGQRTWAQDMLALMPHAPDYPDVRRQVERYLKSGLFSS